MEAYLLTLLASITVAALFVVLSKITKDERLKKIFFLIALLFVFFLLIKTAVISPDDNRLNSTSEDSLYWNCSALNHTCTGQPSPEACNAYDVTQCLALEADGENCSWSQGICLGTPTWTCAELGVWGHTNGYGHLKCTETEGCILTFELVSAECDLITVTYNYEHTPEFSDEINTLELTEIIVLFTVFLLVLCYFLVDALKYVSDWMQKLQFKFQKEKPPT